MRHVLRKTALVTTAAAAGLATLSTGASANADAAVAGVTKHTISCKSKQGDKATLTVYKTSIGFDDLKYKITVKGHGRRKANDIEVKDAGAIGGTEKYVKRNAWSGKTYRWKRDLYGRSAGYVHVKFIFDIPKKDDHWCKTKKFL
ncbi:hypothetical protein [Actinomadura sp. 6N118]|uniref:hypothetical protein n=1 Tax=Actinomadura sp. 6N118 TaxID=3375151 RepID=UPI0037A04F31